MKKAALPVMDEDNIRIVIAATTTVITTLRTMKVMTWKIMMIMKIITTTITTVLRNVVIPKMIITIMTGVVATRMKMMTTMMCGDMVTVEMWKKITIVAATTMVTNMITGKGTVVRE
jgi:hypothetical protein